MLTTITLAHITNSSPWTSEVSSDLVPNIQAGLCFVPNQNFFDNVPLPLGKAQHFAGLNESLRCGIFLVYQAAFSQRRRLR